MFSFLLFVGYFCLSYGQNTPPVPPAVTIRTTATTATPPAAATTTYPFTPTMPATTTAVMPFPPTTNPTSAVSRPIVLGLRVSVTSAIELNVETIQPILNQILFLIGPNQNVTLFVKNILLVTPQ
ncbi:hypothetical protein AAFF_G00118340 [Aldrovandia affinis]|uniref:Uncharacterized protein n=1 Tax=Aldrovandia affinis TaxID=143900 RepID=A0AAD7RSN7_9TELE|nr:hypothetical protein AAFF_G00118340 [Aldrovandia affinis]